MADLPDLLRKLYPSKGFDEYVKILGQRWKCFLRNPSLNEGDTDKYVSDLYEKYGHSYPSKLMKVDYRSDVARMVIQLTEELIWEEKYSGTIEVGLYHIAKKIYLEQSLREWLVGCFNRMNQSAANMIKLDPTEMSIRDTFRYLVYYLAENTGEIPESYLDLNDLEEIVQVRDNVDKIIDKYIGSTQIITVHMSYNTGEYLKDRMIDENRGIKVIDKPGDINIFYVPCSKIDAYSKNDKYDIYALDEFELSEKEIKDKKNSYYRGEMERLIDWCEPITDENLANIQEGCKKFIEDEMIQKREKVNKLFPKDKLCHIKDIQDKVIKLAKDIIFERNLEKYIGCRIVKEDRKSHKMWIITKKNSGIFVEIIQDTVPYYTQDYLSSNTRLCEYIGPTGELLSGYITV